MARKTSVDTQPYRLHKDRLMRKPLSVMVASTLAIIGTQSVAQPVLEEIIITAQKRSESLQDVPIAVSAFSQDALESQGLVGGSDLKIAVPNVAFNDLGFGRFNFQIRGVGAFLIGPSADTGVGIHQNNIPLQQNRLPTAEFYDVERVEVLRGPQGTLYGRNSTGGVVNVLTNKPDSEFSAKLTGELGNYNSKRINGHLNLPIDDQLAIRFAGSMIDRDGTIENTGTGNDVDSKDVYSLRASVKWQPTESFYATALWESFRQDDSSGANQKTLCAVTPGVSFVGAQPTDAISQAILKDSCQNVAATDPQSYGVANSLGTLPGIFNYYAGTSAPNYFQGATVDPDLRTIDKLVDPLLVVDNDLFSVELGFDISDSLSFTSVTAYAKDDMQLSNTSWGATPTQGFNVFHPLIDSDGVYVDPNLGPVTTPINRFYLNRETEQISQELRLQSDYEGVLNFSLGALYMQFEQLNQTINLGSSPNQFAQLANLSRPPVAQVVIEQGYPPTGAGHNYFNNQSDYELTASALFGEVYYNLSDTMKLTTGLRYTRDEKVIDNYPVKFLQPGFGLGEPVRNEKTFEEVTGRVTLDWSVTEDTLLYASFAKGYKGGGINPAIPDGVTTTLTSSFDPEFVNALEIGSKSLFADGRLSLNTSLFHYDYEGYQVAKTAFQSVFTENIDSKIQGFEAELLFQTTDYLRFNSQIGWLKTEISSGESIDPLNKLQGSDDMMVVRDFRGGGGIGQTCLVPTAVVEGALAAINAGQPSFFPYPSVSSSANVGLLCGAPGASEGDAVSLTGKELPYSPSWTASLGAELDIELGGDWLSTLRFDYYAQGESYARVYNAVQDKIEGYDNLNVSYRIESETQGLDILFYARNLLSTNNIVTITADGDNTGGGLQVGGKQPVFYGISLTKRWD